MSQGLFAWIAQRNAPTPNAPCFLRPSGAMLTYGDVFAAADRAAGALAALGVQPGDRVAVQVEKSVEALLLYLGCARMGAVLLPMNTAYTPAEVAYFLGDAEPALLVCDPARKDGLRDATARTPAVATLGRNGEGDLWPRMQAAPAYLGAAPRADDLQAILYTSGTTGKPKGAMLSNGNLLTNAQALVQAWRFSAADRLIHALPIFHTHGLFVATNTVLAAGASAIVQPGFDADAVIDAFAQATVLMGVPTHYVRLLDSPRLTREATRGMRLFVSGSAPLLAETHRTFTARTGHEILERYGMTETNMNISNPYEGPRVPGAVGQPLPGVEARIVDPDTGAPVEDGQPGMIEVRGPNVFKGYWRQPEKTASEFRPDGFFITGDIGVRAADGFYSIVGRAKDLIISGGLNVYPKEVEDAIDALPGVLESAVIGVPHPDFGEGVTAIVVPQPGAALDEAALIAQRRTVLAAFKTPKRVLVRAELPRNTMGKVQKAALRQELAALYARA